MKALHSFRRICNLHLCQLQGHPICIRRTMTRMYETEGEGEIYVEKEINWDMLKDTQFNKGECVEGNFTP